MTDIWLLLGPEIGLKNQRISQIIEAEQQNIADTQETLEIVKLFVSDMDVQSIANEMKISSLFSSYRVLIIKQIEMWSASDVKVIVAGMQNKSSHVKVILMSENTKVSQSLEKIVLKKNKQIFWALSETDYTDYIMFKTEKMGLTLHPDAVELIVYFAGENTTTIDNFLQQIALFMRTHADTVQDSSRDDKKNLIRKDDILQWFSHYKHEDVFKLFSEIIKHRYHIAFETLDALCRSGEDGSRIIAGLVYQIKRGLHVRRGLDDGQNQATLFNELAVRNFVHQRELMDFVSNLSQSALQDMLVLCEEADARLRSVSNMRYQSIELSRLIYYICMLHRHPHYQPTKKLNSHYNISNIYVYDW